MRLLVMMVGRFLASVRAMRTSSISSTSTPPGETSVSADPNAEAQDGEAATAEDPPPEDA